MGEESFAGATLKAQGPEKLISLEAGDSLTQKGKKKNTNILLLTREGSISSREVKIDKIPAISGLTLSTVPGIA